MCPSSRRGCRVSPSVWPSRQHLHRDQHGRQRGGIPAPGDARRQRPRRPRHDRVQRVRGGMRRGGRLHHRSGDLAAGRQRYGHDRRLYAAGSLAQHERARRHQRGIADRRLGGRICRAGVQRDREQRHDPGPRHHRLRHGDPAEQLERQQDPGMFPRRGRLGPDRRAQWPGHRRLQRLEPADRRPGGRGPQPHLRQLGLRHPVDQLPGRPDPGQSRRHDGLRRCTARKRQRYADAGRHGNDDGQGQRHFGERYRQPGHRRQHRQLRRRSQYGDPGQLDRHRRDRTRACRQQMVGNPPRGPERHRRGNGDPARATSSPTTPAGSGTAAVPR